MPRAASIVVVALVILATLGVSVASASHVDSSPNGCNLCFVAHTVAFETPSAQLICRPEMVGRATLVTPVSGYQPCAGQSFLVPAALPCPSRSCVFARSRKQTLGRGEMKYILFGVLALCSVIPAFAQGIGSAGTITGTVSDPSGANIPGATIEIQNKVTGYDKSASTDATGAFKFLNVPPNNYHTEVKAAGFQAHVEDIMVRTTVALNLAVAMALASSTTSVEVHSDTDLVESVPTAHVDVDASQMAKLPMSSPTGGLNSVIAHSAPGIIEDSNGFIHPQGDHAQTQFVFDNQPITDQQSKQFSTSMPENAIASVEVITGAPPAEYGDKTSLVINAITKSGLGVDKPFGSFTTSYGSFGTTSESLTSGVGGQTWGDFISINGVRSGRYLDSPEFSALHDVGNNQTIFNRFDYQADHQNDSLHLNLFVARSWFQTPNTYDQQFAGQDQRELILSYNIAPGWVHILNAHSTVTVNPYVRRDQVHYDPSRNPFADLPATVGETRQLMNAGIKADYAWVDHHNNFKAGTEIQQTFLNEGFFLGITQPGFVAASNSPGLAPYDLTDGGHLFTFAGHTDIKEYALYAQDNLTFGGLNIQAGLRADFYRGLTGGQSLEPRLGISYLVKPSNTVLRISYSKFLTRRRTMRTYLYRARTGAGGLAGNVFGAFGTQPLRPPEPVTSTTPGCSRASAGTCWWMPATSGSTPTMPLTSTICSTRRSRFRSKVAQRARSMARRRA